MQYYFSVTDYSNTDNNDKGYKLFTYYDKGQKLFTYYDKG